MKNVMVTVSPQSKQEFLTLVGLAMGQAVASGLEIEDFQFNTAITFVGSDSDVLFFSDLHTQWHNKGLTKLAADDVDFVDPRKLGGDGIAMMYGIEE